MPKKTEQAAAEAAQDVRVSTNRVQPASTPARPHVPIKPGPMTNGAGGISAADGDMHFITKNATAAELKEFRAAIEARLHPAKKGAWIDLPGGMRIAADYALFGCTRCGKWTWLRAGGGGDCVKCGASESVRPATKKETAAWMKREAEKDAAWKAGAAGRRAEIGAFNKRAAQDSRDGREDFIKGR